MPGVMRKMGVYLGLVEDDEHDQYAQYDDYDETYEEPSVRRYHPEAAAAATTAATRRSFDTGRTPVQGSAALDPTSRHVAAAPAPSYDEGYRITTLNPYRYDDAKAIGEHFRNGTPVIMNVTDMDDADAKRLVDFAAGLTFGLHGRLERVTNKVFLLSPQHVDVTAEDRARIVEGGFFNQS